MSTVVDPSTIDVQALIPPDPDSVNPLTAEQQLLIQELVSLQMGDVAREELQAIEAVLQRRSWRMDPARWVQDRLGEYLWSVQRTILNSVRDFRKTAVMSCHEIGKSFISARAVGWWIDCHPPGEAFAVTTAPTGRQVRAVLWKEINRVHARGLAGRTNQTEWHLPMPSGKEEMVAFGFKPADYDPTAFQGIHAPYVLVIPDESCGIPTLLFDAMESLVANDTSKMLGIGNPDFPASEFYRICKPGSGWNVIQVGAFDTPEFTGEPCPASVLRQLIGRLYVEDKRKRWAPNWHWVDAQEQPCSAQDGRRVVPPSPEDAKNTHPFWQSKVLGLFPSVADEGSLLPLELIAAAQARTLQPEDGPGALGVDVGAGGDSSTACHRSGHVYRVLLETHIADTMRTCGDILSLRRRLASGDKMPLTKVDRIGIGTGLCDRAAELQEPDFVGVNVGDSPYCTCGMEARKKPCTPECAKNEFVNLRAQYWWAVREHFIRGTMDIDAQDEDLADELTQIRYARTSGGKIQIEPKAAAKKRGVRSPNRADALMLACADVSKLTPPPRFGGLVF